MRRLYGIPHVLINQDLICFAVGHDPQVQSLEVLYTRISVWAIRTSPNG